MAPPRKSTGTASTATTSSPAAASTSNPPQKTSQAHARPRAPHGTDPNAPGPVRGRPAAPTHDEASFEDLLLPRSTITRLTKGVLPPSTHTHKDAVLAIARSASVFISHLASEASERAVANGKKSVQVGDVVAAVGAMEFEGFEGRVAGESGAYVERKKGGREEYRRRVRGSGEGVEQGLAVRPSPRKGGEFEGSVGGAAAHEMHIAKRARLEEGAAAGGEGGLDDDDDEVQGEVGDEGVDDDDEEGEVQSEGGDTINEGEEGDETGGGEGSDGMLAEDMDLREGGRHEDEGSDSESD